VVLALQRQQQQLQTQDKIYFRLFTIRVTLAQ